MDFVPLIKTKKIHQSKGITSFKPFPEIKNFEKIVGTFDGFSVEIIENQNICKIYENGCFGKGSRSRSAPEIIQGNNSDGNNKETLVLDMEESFFLSHILKVLQIKNVDGEILNSDEILDIFCDIRENFVERMMAYLYLKSKNWIIKSGMKFGGDYLLYKNSLQNYHASFIVKINNDKFLPKDIQGLQRIAETANKDVIFLDVRKSKNLNVFHKLELFDHLEKFSITESIIKRFNFNQYVHTK